MQQIDQIAEGARVVGRKLRVGAEPVVNKGEYAVGCVNAGSVEVELRSGGVEEEKYYVVEEKGAHNYKRHAVEAPGTFQNDQQHHGGNNDEVGEVA